MDRCNAERTRAMQKINDADQLQANNVRHQYNPRVCMLVPLQDCLSAACGCAYSQALE